MDKYIRIVIISVLLLLLLFGYGVKFLQNKQQKRKPEAQAQAQAEALLSKKKTLQKQTLLSIQKIGIQHDNYSGHLFRFIIMVLFHLSYLNKDSVEIYI